MKILVVIIRGMKPCSLAGGYHRLGGTDRFHLQGRSESSRNVHVQWKRVDRRGP
jgi:hypothetical protein